MTTIEENKMSTDSFVDPSFEQQSSHKIFESTREQRTEARFNFWSNSPNSVFLIVLSIFEAIIVIALEAVIFAKFYHTE